MDSKFGPDGALYVQTYDGFFRAGHEHRHLPLRLRRRPVDAGRGPARDPDRRASRSASQGRLRRRLLQVGVRRRPATSDRGQPDAYLRRGQALHGQADGDLRRRLDGHRARSTSTCSPQADEAAPTTTHTITPAAPTGDGTYKKPVTITLDRHRHAAASRRGPHRVPHQRRRVDGLLGARDPSAAGHLQVRLPLDVTARATSRRSRPSRTRSRWSRTARPNLNDEFNGTSLDPKWTIAGPPRSTPAALSVADGVLRLKIENGDMIGRPDTARNVLLQRAPAGSWVISTKINTSELTNEGEQAGLILWQSEQARHARTTSPRSSTSTRASRGASSTCRRATTARTSRTRRSSRRTRPRSTCA